MKKLISMLLCVVLLSFTLCACGSGAEKTKENMTKENTSNIADDESSEVESTAETTSDDTTTEKQTTTEQPSTTVKQEETTKEQETTKKHVHSFSKKITKATCTKNGYTTYTCSCGESYIDDYIDANGHNYTSKVIAPTCTKNGYTVYACSCGEEYVANYTTANGHTEVIDKAVEATTMSTGLTEGKHCSTCGEILIEQTVIPQKNSPSEKSTFEYPTDKVLRTYISIMNADDYNEYIIEDISIETKDTSETEFQLKVTLYVIMLDESGDAPDYIKGSWHLKKDGKNVDWSHFTISDAFILEGRYVTFTVNNLKEGNYTLSFNGYF